MGAAAEYNDIFKRRIIIFFPVIQLVLCFPVRKKINIADSAAFTQQPEYFVLKLSVIVVGY